MIIRCKNSLTGAHKWLEKVGKNKDKPDQCILCNQLRESIEHNTDKERKENGKEEPYEHAPWALNKVEGVKCTYCGDRSLKDKNDCMQNGCPYHLDGDDGMY